MALVLALALMTGMQRELRNRILGATAHLFVWKHGGITDYQAESAALRTVPDVTGAAPAIIGKALISSGRGEAFITLKGIDPALERGVTDIEGAMKSGRLDERGRRTRATACRASSSAPTSRRRSASSRATR